MSRRQQWVYHVEPSLFPEDFPERLQRFKDAAGLSWRGLARRLRVRMRCVWRWKAVPRPDPGHLFSLFTAAEEMGLLHTLLHGAQDQAVATRGPMGGEPCLPCAYACLQGTVSGAIARVHGESVVTSEARLAIGE